MAVDVFSEGFEGGSVPSDWQVWEESTYSESWEVVDYFYHSGEYAAMRNRGIYSVPYYMYGDDSWLVMPTLDMTGYENLEFSCWYLGQNYSGISPEVYIMGSDVSSPGTGDFNDLLDMGSYPVTYEERVADASVYDDEPNVTFAIRYIAITTGGPAIVSDLICIDDVLITGDLIQAVEGSSLGKIKAIYR